MRFDGGSSFLSICVYVHKIAWSTEFTISIINNIIAGS
jgi:hypothetical protein